MAWPWASKLRRDLYGNLKEATMCLVQNVLTCVARQVPGCVCEDGQSQEVPCPLEQDGERMVDLVPDHHCEGLAGVSDHSRGGQLWALPVLSVPRLCGG